MLVNNQTRRLGTQPRSRLALGKEAEPRRRRRRRRGPCPWENKHNDYIWGCHIALVNSQFEERKHSSASSHPAARRDTRDTAETGSERCKHKSQDWINIIFKWGDVPQEFTAERRENMTVDQSAAAVNTTLLCCVSCWDLTGLFCLVKRLYPKSLSQIWLTLTL